MNPAMHRVSALAERARWVLAQQAVAEKSNEITTIPDLLALLDLQGAVGSADAMGCQKTIARTIVEGGADSVLALEDFLSSLTDQERFAATVRGHGGIENQPHGVLEVQFGEDACRTRNDHSAENLALIRRIALNVPRHNGPPCDSIRRRKLRAALDDDHR
ncbi:MAG: ISAs1 family transposase [Candidatus Competibacter sp.]|nr:ISAs1 family transposase [Candidatus Competibacter sp.]